MFFKLMSDHLSFMEVFPVGGQNLEHAFCRVLLQSLQLFWRNNVYQKIKYFGVVDAGKYVAFLSWKRFTCKVLRFESKVKAQAR